MNKKRDFIMKRRVCLLTYLLTYLLTVPIVNVSASSPETKTTAAQQQAVKISGTVTDNTGSPLIGATVEEKGVPTNGAITDIDGKYSLTVAPNAEIEVKYIGYLTYSLKVSAGKTVYDFILEEDHQSLDEVVVVGYGVQKKKLLTGATINVSGENIQKLSTTSALTALQSQTPGVNIIQNNGQPGSGFIVNIRGIGTNGNNSPLYVIDGVPSGDSALDNFSPADIESIDILKDAASAAIYGSRAANGVVLITTKQGKAGKTVLSYDGYYGSQYMLKKQDMLNAREYILIQNETNFNDGTAPYDWANLLPAGMYDNVMSGKDLGTDWVDAFYNPGANTQNHALNLTGGNDNSKFSIGYSFTKQDGILGEAVAAQYNRHTVRINSDHVVKKGDGFDILKIGETLSYNYRANSGISTGNIYWNGLHSLLVTNPLLPAYDKEGNYYDYDDKVENGWNFDGNTGNPIAAVALSSQGLNLSKNHGLTASASLQIQPIRGLIFKSQYGYAMSAGTYRSQDQKRHLSNNTNVTIETVSQSAWAGYSWTLENTLFYGKDFNGHHVDALLGQSIEKSGYGDNVSASGQNNIFELGWDYAWVDNTKPTELSQRGAGGSPWGEGALASFFGRVNYNFQETIMAQFSLRADGSSIFARGHRWGYFPSGSLGWIVTNNFLEGSDVIDYLKLRASWGQNGNNRVGGFQYLTTYNFPQTALYYFGTDKSTPSTGAVAGVLKNPDITWETQEQTDLGLDARFINNRLGLTFDWYKRSTKDWLVTAPISSTWGFSAPSVNAGTVENKGYEISLTWNDHIGSFTYGINANFSYNKNEVTQLDNAEGIIHGAANTLSQGTDEFTRVQVGYPMGYFYGYKADGIFQNWEEVEAYVNSKGQAIIPGAQPGDVRFRDIDNDGAITPADRTMLGCGWPDSRAGFSVQLGYKGLDFSVVTSGAFGMEIAKSYRSFADSKLQNYSTDVFLRWTGEGTSNKWPRLTSGSHINYQNLSDIFLESGDYLKVQNVTLGYSLKQLMPKLPVQAARVYVSALNLYTFTKYSGVDPEVGWGPENWSTGIDLGYYPAARTYMVGVNITF
ncbi:MAG: TonB-dependent receptor [Dysgonamonadaceae bacterium]|jgi:TonB-linked SusC/RagA family outer membrane protein|nr:TonB-dependent receptor [Dysgonamonadaceae bacterium]